MRKIKRDEILNLITDCQTKEQSVELKTGEIVLLKEMGFSESTLYQWAESNEKMRYLVEMEGKIPSSLSKVEEWTEIELLDAYRMGLISKEEMEEK